MLAKTLSSVLDHFSSSTLLSPSTLIVIALGWLSLHLVLTWQRLRAIPGPSFAKFTDLYRLLVVWRRDSHDTYLELHKKHGDLVRIGPNCVSISKPEVINTIYGISVKASKSDFYSVWQNIVNGKRTASLVFTTDEQQHATMKRPIASAYSLSTLVEFEPLIDSTTAVFLDRVDQLFATTGKECDLGTWLQWYAFDVIGELTLSKRLGFLERAEDVENIADSIAANFDRCSVLGQMPWLDEWIYKSRLFQRIFVKGRMNPILAFGQRRLQERLDSKDNGESMEVPNLNDAELNEKVLHGTLPSKPDFLSRFLKLHDEQPEVVTNQALLAYLFININAGSDTIASTTRAIFYYLLKNPSTLDKLREELEEAQKQDKLTTPLPTWTEVQALPYLNAVIKEGLRFNPALALPLERVTPANGFQLGETFIPPGTIVGVNPWVLHRDTRIFGSDAEAWNPDRWLSGDSEQVKYMDHHILSFGAGKRTCLGRNIAMLEMSKLVPAMVFRYDMKLKEPKKDWKLINAWAVRQEGLDVTLAKR
ncbi:hypothetical protein CKM354_000772100 [Cercospora kikuchii]|uniref:Pisatin demethylase n=1 Tax=Cercospora kikuchii TaxID=84275 RepID=A0A9P3CQ08_9PEZI|nr:uncharacterized protein CKM354_000772100 [Cercospora kikuchii]GIZ44525.1 hypothetical protein CKM354_000772100 [Cercospora kikuchii]